MRAKLIFWVFALLVSAGIGPALAADASVSISNFTFHPADLQIKAGSTVTFRNDDDIPHRVAAEDGSFSTKALDSDDKATITFARPGVFPYFCTIHPHMRGKVTVTP
ncbi:MAG: cupredoxin family copper-binding protein [Methylovirgula sp.]|nr:cupredoxin family copper-binding protein [Methylovirgula sp.]